MLCPPVCPTPHSIPIVSLERHLRATKGKVLPSLDCFPENRDRRTDDIDDLGHLSNRPHTSAGTKAPTGSAHVAATLKLRR